MRDEFSQFLLRYDSQFAKTSGGAVTRVTLDFRPIATEAILTSLHDTPGLAILPGAGAGSPPYEALARWIIAATPEQLKLADLAIPMPPATVHFVPGLFKVFYDFKNTDIVLDELTAASVPIAGRVLDFGCSSGRNLAVLKRAYGDALDLYGSDPAQPSIDWLNANVPGVEAVVSDQTPPLPFADATFDIVIAKSIWTHFSIAAGRTWFEEMHRVLKPGGHFIFSTHGPHDIASRILHDFPAPRYERFAGHDSWTRDAFLLDLIRTFDADGCYFQPYKQVGHQSDLKLVENASTADWGVTFMSEEFLRTLLPAGLRVVRRSIARTGNRHDLYVVRRDG